MPRFSLRTLIIVMLLAPPLIVGASREWQALRARKALRQHLKKANPPASSYLQGFTPKYDFPSDYAAEERLRKETERADQRRFFVRSAKKVNCP
jgi:hypothetical protein